MPLATARLAGGGNECVLTLDVRVLTRDRESRVPSVTVAVAVAVEIHDHLEEMSGIPKR